MTVDRLLKLDRACERNGLLSQGRLAELVISARSNGRHLGPCISRLYGFAEHPCGSGALSRGVLRACWEGAS